MLLLHLSCVDIASLYLANVEPQSATFPTVPSCIFVFPCAILFMQIALMVCLFQSNTCTSLENQNQNEMIQLCLISTIENHSS